METEIILPFAPEFTAYSYRNVFTRITSPGLPSVERNTGYQTVTNIPTIAMSQRLGQRSLSTLDKTVKQRNSNDPRFANSYNPEHLSTDWRAYTALDYLLIDLEAWQQIEQAQRRAILEWVRLGGILDIFGTEGGLFRPRTEVPISMPSKSTASSTPARPIPTPASALGSST